MFLRFTRRIKPIDFRIMKQTPYPFLVEDILINPLQVTHIVVSKTTISVHMAGGVCHSTEEVTPSLAVAEFQRIEREMKRSLSKILRDTEPKSKELAIRWDMPTPEMIAMEELR